ncbi:hypothetical protein GQ54DRAFT_255654 [Martensiomyces pterosporus]|nr:hypothetical protein GQ54DRAFT_255654 [Martensiomyces pterosporus]
MTKLFGAILCAAAATLAAVPSAIAAPSGNNGNSGNNGEIIYNPDAPTYTLQRGALDSSNIPFSNHSIDKPFGSYLQQTLDFAPFQVLFNSINATVGTLKSRGEAHITVVTPPEFDRVLKPAGVTIQEIQDIALKRDIQCARLKPVCLGRFSGSLPNPLTDADKGKFLLYSVVLADVHGDLVNIRRDIFKLYRKKGGEGALFQPEGFWPHVTIGFDRRDLFIEDGFYKGSNYCYAPIRTVKN